MDRPATPWRVLDDASPGGPTATSDASQDDLAAPPSPPRLPWTALVGFVLAAVLAIGAFLVAASAPRGEVTVDGGTTFAASGSPRGSAVAPSGAAELVVDVQGAVLRPGVHRLDPGSRVGDAIASAGGYGPRVDAERAGRELNLAAALKDGDRIVVPSRDDPLGPAGPESAGPAASNGGQAGTLVDLNSATAAQLDELPGIGPVTAAKIMDAREEKPFASIDELRDRKIIGSSAFEKLRDLVTVR
jgi:competence protein ComEA